MMRISTILLSLLTATLLCACSQLLDVNDNPNLPVNVPLEQRLPNALLKSYTIQTSSSSSTSSPWSLNQLGCVWVGYWSKAVDGPSFSSLFRLEETYAVEAMAFDRDGRPFWEDIFSTLNNYKDIENKALENSEPIYAGIAQIMQAYHFFQLVDLYNNVPFDEALQGTKYPNPRYEDGKVVYEKSIRLISKGMDNITKANANAKKPSNDDIIFKGNLNLWLKLGNTIKLRALLKQSELSQAGSMIADEIRKIELEGSGYLGVGESALVNPGFTNSSGMQNPFWETFYKNPQGAFTAGYHTLRPTEFIIDQYQQVNDPRLKLLYKPMNGIFKGVPLGQSTGSNFQMSLTSALLGPSENGNRPAAIFKAYSQAGVLLGSFESLFLQAEAAERGWISASPSTLYENAIRESLKYMEVPADEQQAYLDQETVQYAMAVNKLEQIILQKWLSLNSIGGFEAWNDYRRLGYPSNLPQSLQSPNIDPSYRPRRLTYRQSETSTNPSQVANQGSIHPFIDRVFWNQ
jgi:hypothetical protein